MLPQRPDSEPTGLLHPMRHEIDRFAGDAPQFDGEHS